MATSALLPPSGPQGPWLLSSTDGGHAGCARPLASEVSYLVWSSGPQESWWGCGESGLPD